MSRFSKIELLDEVVQEKVREELASRKPLETAERCLEEGFFEPALRYYSQALAENNQDERAWLRQAVCLVHLGEFEEAVAWCDRALGTVPDCTDLLAAKAVAWGRQGDTDRALGFSDNSFKKGEDSAFAWWARGDVLLALNARNAVYSFQQASAHAGRDPAILEWVAMSCLSAGMAGEARPYLAKAKAMARKNSFVWYLIGITLRDLGMKRGARNAFQRAIVLNSRRFDAAEALEGLPGRGLFEKLLGRLRGRWRRQADR